MSGVRIDKWLWAVRLFKTRSIASEACKKGVVRIEGNTIKPSRLVNIGDVVVVTREPVKYQYRVVELLQKRVGAKLVANYLKDITPPEDLEILEIMKYSNNGVRDRGVGRPTKRDRRDIERCFDGSEDDI